MPIPKNYHIFVDGHDEGEFDFQKFMTLKTRNRNAHIKVKEVKENEPLDNRG